MDVKNQELLFPFQFYDRTSLASSDSKWAASRSTPGPPGATAEPAPPRPANVEKGWGWETAAVGGCMPITPRFRANPGGGVLDITGEGCQCPIGCCWWWPPLSPSPAKAGIPPEPLRPPKRPPRLLSPPVNCSRLLFNQPGGESERNPGLCGGRLSAIWPLTIAGSSVVQSFACGDLMLFQPENREKNIISLHL